MGIVVRPNKPTGGGGGAEWIPDVELLADELNDDIQGLYDTINGNIDTTNLSPSAGILGTQIASKPNGIGTTNITAKAVTSVELANDAATDALRAVGPDHIKDAAIILRHLKVTTFDWAPTGSIAGGAIISQATGVTTTNGIPLSIIIMLNGVPTASLDGVFDLWLNTATLEYYLRFRANSLILDISPFDFRLLYLQAS